MKVVKKVNNNVVLAVNEKNEEVFLVGKGLGFKSPPYKVTKSDIVEKMYVDSKNIKIFDILNDIPFEDIQLAENIIQIGREILDVELNPNLLITLSDHISFALQRSRDGSEEKIPLAWEVRTLYPKETEIGKKALDLIKKNKGIQLPQSEVVFIALHFVNAQIGSGIMNETRELTKITGEILTLIKYFFKIDFDENDFIFTRFVTHLRYFIVRQISGKSLEGENAELFKVMKDRYPNEVKCVEKIEKHLYSNYGWKCTDEECLYLVLHIRKIK